MNRTDHNMVNRGGRIEKGRVSMGGRRMTRRPFGLRLATLLMALLLTLGALSLPGLRAEASKNAAGAIARGIDVSLYQGDINWQQVAASGISFAFIRVGSSTALDSYFDKNMREAAAAGIRTGVYVYTRATTAEASYAEALAVLKLIEPYTVNMPVVIDMEDKVHESLTPEQNAVIAAQFCAVIESAGYYPMIYSSTSWFNRRIAEAGYSKWVAQWADACGRDDAAFWQYSCTGSIPGIRGDVDLDYQFLDLSDKIVANGFLERRGNLYYYVNYKMVRNRWIDEGGYRYYMSETGAMVRGTFAAIDGAYYYFDGAGHMLTGWQELAGERYYFGTDGRVAIGLTRIGEQTFLFDAGGRLYRGWYHDDAYAYHFDEQDGHMAQGLTALGGKNYCFSPEGHQLFGWQNIGEARYYFNPATNGTMYYGWLDDGTGRYYLNDAGVQVTGLLTLGDGLYYLDPKTGAMQTGVVELGGARYFFGADGRLTTGFVTDGVNYYYFDEATKQQLTGFVKIGADYYYFDPQTGAAQTNTVAYYNGVPFQIGADGKVILR